MGEILLALFGPEAAILQQICVAEIAFVMGGSAIAQAIECHVRFKTHGAGLVGANTAGDSSGSVLAGNQLVANLRPLPFAQTHELPKV